MGAAKSNRVRVLPVQLPCSILNEIFSSLFLFRSPVIMVCVV